MPDSAFTPQIPKKQLRALIEIEDGVITTVFPLVDNDTDERLVRNALRLLSVEED